MRGSIMVGSRLAQHGRLEWKRMVVTNTLANLDMAKIMAVKSCVIKVPGPNCICFV
jgi:hypothetical protein